MVWRIMKATRRLNAGPAGRPTNRCRSGGGGLFWDRLPALILLIAGVLFCPPSSAAAPAEAAEAADRSDEIQRAISLLEDDQRRQEIIKLLKLLDTLDQEKAAALMDQAEAEAAASGSETTAQQPGTPKTFLSDLIPESWQKISIFGSGLRQSWNAMKDVFAALQTPLAKDMWHPYLLKFFIWGLVCLTVAFFIIKKYGRRPDACCSQDFWGKFRAVLKYILVTAGPNLVLIVSLLGMPPLPATAPGVTADMAIGFSFVHTFVQYFFITLSALYICLETAKVLFTPGSGGHAIIDMHPVLARHFLRSLKIFAIYLAALVFFKESFMENFVTGSLFTVMLVILTLPAPIYLTVRLVKLRRLIHTIAEAEASAGLDEESSPLAETDQTPLQPRLNYHIDLFIKKHWTPVIIFMTWALWLLCLINPAETTERLLGHIIFSLALLALAGLAVILVRHMMLRFVYHDTEQSRRLLLYVDILVNMLVWLALVASIVTAWGLPLGRILENALIRDILGRMVAIGLVLAALVIFVKFSRVATEWLLSSPELTYNRNWRTMTPLVLAAARALAIFMGIVVILERLGVNIGPILAGAGILGLGVGMGAQSLVKDVINGISILLMNILAVGDYVTVGGLSGTVEVVGLRSIRLRDASGNLTLVPNSSITSIINMTRDYSQDLVEFVVPYDSDPDKMLTMAREVADDLSGDCDWKSRLISPVAVIGLTAFDSNGTTIRLKINTTAGDQWAVGRELRLRLKRRMLKDGIKSAGFGQNIFFFRGRDDGLEQNDEAAAAKPSEETPESS